MVPMNSFSLVRRDIHFVVGIAVERNREQKTVKLSQTALIDRVTSQFGLADAYPAKTPFPANTRLSKDDSPRTDSEKTDVAHLPYRQLVGSLMYIAVGTRPDIAHAVQQLNQFNDCFGRVHWNHAKHVVRYLKGTILPLEEQALSNFLATQTPTTPIALIRENLFLAIAFLSVRASSHGCRKNNPLSPHLPVKRNIFLLASPPKKQFGFEPF
jgi:hypothetical protein